MSDVEVGRDPEHDTERDAEQIRRLIARLVQLYDRHRHEEWIAAYLADDTVLAAPGGTLYGREAIRAEISKVPDDGWRAVHLLGKSAITVTGTSAHALTDVVNVKVTGAGGYAVTGFGRYDDRLDRGADGTWRLTTRTRTIAGAAAPAAD
ncbi:nuclear transport factor 2 family protein [Parafrankia sp. EUN1f]|uniref:nuclear transport factor 2 family protein n=1 Tax=Parafrankia sp. EUN1f TaxID=102897 RepID=UPI0001C43A11|nr:nuclear transport factor 2 family protein [Parafrankia sp. EUN1f]EFC85242.1 hypothetical protein FrEUN1fDRAFT_1695 [Parafrankia sp. EUN1f]